MVWADLDIAYNIDPDLSPQDEKILELARFSGYEFCCEDTGSGLDIAGCYSYTDYSDNDEVYELFGLESPLAKGLWQDLAAKEAEDALRRHMGISVNEDLLELWDARGNDDYTALHDKLSGLEHFGIFDKGADCCDKLRAICNEVFGQDYICKDIFAYLWEHCEYFCPFHKVVDVYHREVVENGKDIDDVDDNFSDYLS